MSKKPSPTPIPVEFLINMGTSEVNLHGDKVTVHVADCLEVVDKRIANLWSYLESNTKVVGLDMKSLNHKNVKGIFTPSVIILCVSHRCLIIHLDHLHCDGMKSLIKFLQDPKICFVGIRTIDLRKMMMVRVAELQNNAVFGVKVGDLCSRILRKPTLMNSGLGDLAKKVGVTYNGPKIATREMEIIASNLHSLTDEKVIAAVSDAYAYYKIGYKLLSSL